LALKQLSLLATGVCGVGVDFEQHEVEVRLVRFRANGNCEEECRAGSRCSKAVGQKLDRSKNILDKLDSGL
jgi:hypothetical protein